MRNFLIRLLGGVTSTEYAELFSLLTRNKETSDTSESRMFELYNQERARVNHLEELVLLKAGYLPGEVVKSEVSTQVPIGGSKNPRLLLHQLQKKDHDEFVKRKAESLRSRG